MNRRLRIAVAGILHETNTCAPGITVVEHFQGEWSAGLEAFTARYAGTRTSAPADATHVLAELVGVSQRSLIVICDPEAAVAACQIGLGGVFEDSVGGKSDRLHGKPVAVKGMVRLLFDGAYRHVGPYMTGQRVDMGRTAVIECGQLTIVLTEKRVAPWDLGHVLSVGLRPEDFKIIVAKSAIAWQAAFGPIAKHVINIDSPGCCSASLRHFQYDPSNLGHPIL